MPPYSPPPRNAGLPPPATASSSNASTLGKAAARVRGATIGLASSSSSSSSTGPQSGEGRDEFAYSTTLRRAPSLSLEAEAAEDVRAKAAEAVKWLGAKVGMQQAHETTGSDEYHLIGSNDRLKKREETPSERFSKLDVAVSSFPASRRGVRRLRPRRAEPPPSPLAC